MFSEVGVAHESEGFFSLKTDSKQKFSGKLYVEGDVLAISGTFDLSGAGISKAVTRNGKTSLTVRPILLATQQMSPAHSLHEARDQSIGSHSVVHPSGFEHTKLVTRSKGHFSKRVQLVVGQSKLLKPSFPRRRESRRNRDAIVT